MPERAQQPAPHATPHTPVAGGTEYQRLMDARQALETRYWRLMKAIRAGTVADIQQANRDIDRLESRMRALARDLSEIDTRRAAPAGLPYLYAVRVEALGVTGYLEATYAPERYTLDTRTLPTALHARLSAYLLGGRDALPYWYRKERARYRPSPKATDDDRALMTDLWKWCKHEELPDHLVKVGASS
ncbi:hypothetical protein DEIPH_ctg011orf0036 [Deinococcus phoenicis]|uniref:Uncharacterized protein n=2 Tax=Deinococcus phoenicis TaxID=1476583 RepID=A0A016QTI0_9DEIO|nr:hypothetical protein DEIPH_ctg011orf0036 [Deinococcus phoenicis]